MFGEHHQEDKITNITKPHCQGGVTAWIQWIAGQHYTQRQQCCNAIITTGIAPLLGQKSTMVRDGGMCQKMQHCLTQLHQLNCHTEQTHSMPMHQQKRSVCFDLRQDRRTFFACVSRTLSAVGFQLEIFSLETIQERAKCEHVLRQFGLQTLENPQCGFQMLDCKVNFSVENVHTLRSSSISISA